MQNVYKVTTQKAFSAAQWEICTVGNLNSGKFEPGRVRTADPLIKSQLLYRLSYRPIQGFLDLLSFVPSLQLARETLG